MVMSAEYMSKFKAFFVMVTSPCEWKILEWDIKPQTNNHIFFRMNKFFLFVRWLRGIFKAETGLVSKQSMFYNI